MKNGTDYVEAVKHLKPDQVLLVRDSAPPGIKAYGPAAFIADTGKLDGSNCPVIRVKAQDGDVVEPSASWFVL